jgi:hypothetical protein
VDTPTAEINPDPPTQEPPTKTNTHAKVQRRVYPEELKKEAVQMLLDGHSVPSMAHKTAGQPLFG